MANRSYRSFPNGRVYETIYLDKKEKTALRKVAEKTRTPVSWIVRNMILELIDKDSKKAG